MAYLGIVGGGSHCLCGDTGHICEYAARSCIGLCAVCTPDSCGCLPEDSCEVGRQSHSSVAFSAVSHRHEPHELTSTKGLARWSSFEKTSISRTNFSVLPNLVSS